MQTHLICYADEQMSISQQLCIKSAKEVGKIDFTFAFGPQHIDADFMRTHFKTLTATQRGGGRGYWLWKPYIVNKAISTMIDGDILIYCDSGIEWINEVKHFHLGLKRNDIMLFSNGHRHIDWCKLEVINHMLPDFYDTARHVRESWKQVQASVMLFRVSDYTREFCSRWLAWSCIPGFIDDIPRGPQLPEFREHRNDQSILTNLQIADNLPLHHWPAQYWQGQRKEFPDDQYPQMFYHHRRRNEEWKADFNKYGEKTIETFMKQRKDV